MHLTGLATAYAHRAQKLGVRVAGVLPLGNLGRRTGQTEGSQPSVSHKSQGHAAARTIRPAMQ